MQTPHNPNQAQARSIQITISRPILIGVIGLALLATLCLIIWAQQSQATQRLALARVQAISEFENIAAQARVHEDLARTYSRELSTRHQQSLASTQSAQIDPQSTAQLLAKIESELREAERVMDRLGEVESTVRNRENIASTTPLLSATQLHTQASLRQSIARQREDLSQLRSLSDAVQQRHTLLAQQEAEAARAAREKEAAAKLAAEKAAKDKEAELAAAKARAEHAERVANAKSATPPSPAVNVSSSDNAPWRPAPPSYGARAPHVQSTVVVERVVAAPPVFYYDPFYCRRSYILGFHHPRYYYREELCPSLYPYGYRRPRGGISIGLSFPIR
jgi:hypothetical protein